MLTKIQLEKLQALTVSQKYGKFLEEAINIWKSKIDFRFKNFGINYIIKQSKNKNIKIFESRTNSCCLIGASLIGKETNGEEGYCEAAKRIYGNDINFTLVYEGFDFCDHPKCSYATDEDFLFGVKVGKILKNID